MAKLRLGAVLLSLLALFGGAVRVEGLVLVKPNTTCVCPRNDIRDFDIQEALRPQRDLLLLSLAELQIRDPADFTSYYQLARIHGSPGTTYDEVPRSFGAYPCDQGCRNTASRPVDGYCWHGSMLFPTWHRPYLVLFEQELVKAAKRLANTYPEAIRSTYVAAADQLRLPFWAWENSNGIPTLLTDARRSVVQSTGATIEIPNPLYRYTFQRTTGGRRNGTTTRRDRNLEANFDSSLEGSDAAELGPQVEQALIATSFAEFATNEGSTIEASTDDISTISAENPHNTVHGLVGGDMANVQGAAYDPIFWLHHCNLDKIFAQWQQRHPDSRIGRRSEEFSNFGIATRNRATYFVDGTSPLYPFRWDESNNKAAGFWRSDDAWNIAALGYTYPNMGTPSGCCAAPAVEPAAPQFLASFALPDLVPNDLGYRTILTLEGVNTAQAGAQSFRVYVYIEDRNAKGVRKNLPKNPVQGGKKDRNFAGSYFVFTSGISKLVSGTVDVTDALIRLKLVTRGGQRRPPKDLVKRYVRLIAISVDRKKVERRVKVKQVVSHWGRYENNVFVQKDNLSQPLVKSVGKQLPAPKFQPRRQPRTNKG